MSFCWPYDGGAASPTSARARQAAASLAIIDGLSMGARPTGRSRTLLSSHGPQKHETRRRTFEARRLVGGTTCQTGSPLLLSNLRPSSTDRAGRQDVDPRRRATLSVRQRGGCGPSSRSAHSAAEARGLPASVTRKTISTVPADESGLCAEWTIPIGIRMLSPAFRGMGSLPTGSMTMLPSAT